MSSLHALDLIDRLRGKYAQGPIMANGEPEFGYRTIGEPLPIMLEAADALEAALSQQEAVEPVAWMFQNEETGITSMVDVQQVEWGFEKLNPRLQKICPLYTHTQPQNVDGQEIMASPPITGSLLGSEQLTRVSSKVPQSVEEFIAAFAMDEKNELIYSDDLRAFMAGKALVPVDLLEVAECWLRATLECKSWIWDGDQFDGATLTLKDLQAAIKAAKGKLC